MDIVEDDETRIETEMREEEERDQPDSKSQKEALDRAWKEGVRAAKGVCRFRRGPRAGRRS